MAKNQTLDPDVIETTSVVPTNGQGTAIAKAKPQNPLITYAEDTGEFPDLNDMEIVPIDLASEYWSPEAEGEGKRLLFSHFSESLVPDKFGVGKNDPTAMVLLETANFYEQVDGQIRSIRQASKVLISEMKRQGIGPKAMIFVVYKGKKKLTNGNTGDTWGVFPLKPKS